jgi:hypothetical protein
MASTFTHYDKAKGYDAEHPLIEHLRRKDFIAVCELPVGLLHQKKLVPTVVERFKLTRAWMKLLNEALGLSF